MGKGREAEDKDEEEKIEKPVLFDQRVEMMPRKRKESTTATNTLLLLSHDGATLGGAPGSVMA